MAKLQVRLLVLIALGTISKCQNPGQSPPDGGAVIASGSAPLGCGPPKPINVRYNAIKVRGPDSDVVYQRMTLREVDVVFAFNTSVMLPGGNFVECAKAAASADEAPFKKIDSIKTEYRLSRVVEADDDHPWFTRAKAEDAYLYEYSGNDIVYFENGDLVMVYNHFMDLNFCLNDGAYGLQFKVSTQFGPYPTSLYFFEECGKTIKIGGDLFVDRRVVYSHPGFGCQDYPTGLPDECTVTFEGEDSVLLQYGFGFFFPETVSDDGGLIMKIPVKDLQSEDVEIRDVYKNNSNSLALRAVKNFEVSFQRQPSKRALGFVITVFPESI